MNRLQELFQKKDKNILSVYYTAGYPCIEDTISIAESLEDAGVDFLEIGFPYSDPVADGPVIQQSSQKALHDGMTLEVLFGQLRQLRARVSIPVLLMGYVNPVLQYGIERFCKDCASVGVDGTIIPDLPMQEYEELYQDIFARNNLSNVFLVTPQTSDERIHKIDNLTTGFIYMLSSSATTGKNLEVGDTTEAYFSRIAGMNLKNPRIIGFGISDKLSFAKAAQYANGAIVGSAFVKVLGEPGYMDKIPKFVKSIRP